MIVKKMAFLLLASLFPLLLGGIILCLCSRPGHRALGTITRNPSEPSQLEEDRPPEVFYRDKVVVLMYHHLDPQEKSGLIISPQRFSAHLDMLQREGYTAISLEDLYSFLQGEKTVPPNAVLITFDDGYESVYRYAFPEMKKRNIPGVSFAITAFIGQKPYTIPHYTWAQAREMEEKGVITQSHTHDLHRYGILANGQRGPMLAGPLQGQTREGFKEMVFSDLLRSRREMEKNLHHPVYALALPYGVASPPAIEAAREAGYRLVFTIEEGAVHRHSNPLRLPRINAGCPSVSPEKLHQMIKKAAGAE